MANKTELNAQLDFLEAALDEAGVEYAKVNRDQTNADLEKEIARLESLLPDEGDADTSDESSNDEPKEQDQQASQPEPQQAETQAAEPTGKNRTVKLFKGVNIEITLAGKKMVLQGDKSHSLPEGRARSIVAENLGVFEDDGV